MKSVFGFRVRSGNRDLDFENLNPDFPIERTLSPIDMRLIFLPANKVKRLCDQRSSNNYNAHTMERMILRASLPLSMLPVHSKYLSQAELLVVVKTLDKGDKFSLVKSSPPFVVAFWPSSNAH